MQTGQEHWTFSNSATRWSESGTKTQCKTTILFKTSLSTTRSSLRRSGSRISRKLLSNSSCHPSNSTKSSNWSAKTFGMKRQMVPQLSRARSKSYSKIENYMTLRVTSMRCGIRLRIRRKLAQTRCLSTANSTSTTVSLRLSSSSWPAGSSLLTRRN